MICIKPATKIDSALETARTTLFTDPKRKKGVLSASLGYTQKGTIVYSPIAFYKLLLNIVDPIKYSGVRVYLAAYAPNEPGANLYKGGVDDFTKQLTLIFVPTLLEGNKDDTTACYTILPGDDKPYLLPNSLAATSNKENDIASNWVRYYQENSMVALIVDGVSFTGNANFLETKSLWYDIKYLKRVGDGTGLLEYIECLQQEKDPTKQDYFDNLIIKFSAFLKNETDPATYPYYQLTLTFNFHQVSDGTHSAGKNNYFTFAWTDFSKEDKHRFKHGLRAGDSTDTGKPCPPPNAPNGCSTQGSMLPAN